MHWQQHIASQPLRRLNILNGNPDQIAVTETRQKIRFYDLATGASYPDLEISLNLLDNDTPEERREGLSQLKAPNGSFLPFVDFQSSHLYTSFDGSLRLIHDLGDGLTLEIDDQSIPLDIPREKSVTQVALDRDLGSVAAVTDDHLLYVFQQQTQVNTVFLDAAPILKVFIKMGGSEIVVVYPEKLVLMDTLGKILFSQNIHFAVGSVAMSPSGDWLAIGDADHQLLRLYNHDLVPVRQQHAIDLITTAHRLQLFATMPAPAAPISALDITDGGVLAFAVAGVLCAAPVGMLRELPQPRLLF